METIWRDFQAQEKERTPGRREWHWRDIVDDGDATAAKKARKESRTRSRKKSKAREKKSAIFVSRLAIYLGELPAAFLWLPLRSVGGDDVGESATAAGGCDSLSMLRELLFRFVNGEAGVGLHFRVSSAVKWQCLYKSEVCWLRLVRGGCLQL